MTIRLSLLILGLGAALLWAVPAQADDAHAKPDAHAAGEKHAEGGKAGAHEGHGEEPKYKATVHTADGEKELKYDLRNEAQAKEFHDYLAKGQVHEVALDKQPDLLALRWDLGLWSIVVFVILFFVLSKYAWPQILEGLQKREGNIQGALDDAEKTRAEAKKMQSDLAAQLAQANEQVRGMLDDARKDAVRTTEEMIAKARSEISGDRDRLRRELETARDQAVQELWNQSVQLASLMSTKAIKQNLDQAAHEKLFDEAVRELGGATDKFMKQQA